jgi:acyl carrier protein
MDNINARLVECFTTVFPDTPAASVPAMSVDNNPAWDSVAAITLVNVIEDEFQLQMDLEAIADLDSYSKVLAYVQQHSASA